jgi:hypothetical protein
LVAFDLAHALSKISPPTGKLSTAKKRQYSDDLSRVFSEALEKSMRTHFPKTSSGQGTGTNAASATGIKSVDVAFNIEGLFLGLGLSVKVVGLPEGERGYTHNFKRVSEEWTLETVNLHRYMPYSIIIGMLFLPEDCMTDRKQKTSLSTALEHLQPFRGRRDHNDDADQMEEVYIGVYKPSGKKKGDVFFISAEHDLAPRALPPAAMTESFEQLKTGLVVRFRERNRKLRVIGMP